MVELTKYDKAAERGIIDILETEGVAFRNEFRYRLEKPADYQLDVEFLHHDRIDAALDRLEETGIIKTTDNRGRKRKSNEGRKPFKFYRLTAAPYSKPLQEMIKTKKDCALFIRGLSSYAGFRAQKLWLKVFRELDYNILGEDVDTLDGNTSSIEGDIDFIAEKDGIRFGV